MALSRADLILHPIRGRIMMVLSRRRLTTRQIAQALPDISQASVYRHIAILADAGVLRVVQEVPVRSVFERVYALDEEEVYVRPDEMRQATPDDYLRYFQIYTEELQQLFRRYARQENAAPERDRVSFWGEILYLTREEADAVKAALREVTRKHQENAPTADRLRFYIGRVLIPDSPDTVDSGPPDAPEQNDSQ